MSEDHREDEVGGRCPVCGTEYRRGFDTCADCGVALEPGQTPTERPSAADMPDGDFERVAKDLRADPDAFVALAMMPVADAWATANTLWQHGIDAVFVPRDDPIAPPYPEFDPDPDDSPDGGAGPPPGLERTRPAIWTRPNRPLPAAVVLFVRTEDENRARRVAGRRIGVL